MTMHICHLAISVKRKILLEIKHLSFVGKVDGRSTDESLCHDIAAASVLDRQHGARDIISDEHWHHVLSGHFFTINLENDVALSKLLTLH